MSWIGARCPFCGKARVFLDGVLAAESPVDTYAPQEEFQVVHFTRTGLAAGAHTLAIEVTDQQNPSSTGFWIVVDAFDVTP